MVVAAGEFLRALFLKFQTCLLLQAIRDMTKMASRWVYGKPRGEFA
jgi:hypothetical protein